ncbi:odorant receptor 23a-like [Drosophila innubila]|uniref:odorant receptor 23a-like n=1 Tax=Drosophila innubila TaxID=198719 RepID=UPI00148B8E1B|nr:odorant receptor 23a-like [Drosophila innubila]
MANNGIDYFRINWRVWKQLGAVDLNERKYGSYRFWRALLFNFMVTIVYPVTLLMVMFSFELPLDNLMNFNISITSVATVVKFLMYTRQLNKVLEMEQVFAELDKRVEFVKELEMHKSMTKELRLVSKMFILAYGAAAVNAESSFLFQDKRTLPFPAWFPLDWKNSMLYYLLALF